MRVAQVGSSLYDWGGIERYVAHLSKGLVARGVAVEVLCPSVSPLAQRIEVPHVPLSMPGQFRFDRLPAALRAMRRGRYDVAHIHFSPDFVVPALAARYARVPLVLMTRHLALPWSPSKVGRYLALFDHIIPASDAVGRRLAESGVPGDRMTVAKAGCDPLEPTGTRADTRARLGIPEDAFAVGIFGRLAREKGVEVVLNAASVPERVRYEVFGEGPYLQELRSAASSRATFHGFVPDVADAMDAMDAVALPSVCEEAFAYAALEAMSLGKTIVASNIGGLPEVVVDGETGLLFEAGNSDAFARCVCRLEGDLELCRALGEGAQASHRSTYGLAHMAERIHAVYTDQLAHRGHGSQRRTPGPK